MKGITRLQATVKARALYAEFRRMREDKQRAEKERQQRLIKARKRAEGTRRKIKEGIKNYDS